MRAFVQCWMATVAAIFLMKAQPTEGPQLRIRELAGDQIELTWPNGAAGFFLERTDSLSEGSAWSVVSDEPELGQTDFRVTITPREGEQYFRLREGAPRDDVTVLEWTSPVSGESGVGVTRETILKFSQPLASSTVISNEVLYASFGGRRILSRVELSSDRTRATLFYLEPLPGSARVVVTFEGDLVMDTRGKAVDGDGDGLAGGQALVSFDTLSLTPLNSTAIIGTVYAAELAAGGTNKPLEGVTITVDGREEQIRAVTDAEGKFKLGPVPPGRFFVHIDGRTVSNPAEHIQYPNGSYYPFVGKAWEAVAGKEDNLAGETGVIYLPLIREGTLQSASMIEATTIGFPPSIISTNPDLAGVSITVPPNSLYNDSGLRGGKVGIAPVPPDRLPEPLPQGLEMPIVITVQTDGPLNFDQPAPVCFPNLPDPVLGAPLPAGSKQALISFNHDKGIWEAVGSMTVSADGKFVCSDPGVGVLQPGWHGVGPQPKKPPPPKKKCDEEGSEDSEKLLDICIESSHKMHVNCRRKSMRLAIQEWKICDAIEKSPIGQQSLAWTNCANRAMSEETARLQSCEAEFVQRLEDCRTCYIPPSVPSSKSLPSIRALALPNTADPVQEQLDQIMEELSVLLGTSQVPFTGEVFLRFKDLIDQGNQITGGDAVPFLEALITASEDELAVSARSAGIEPEDLWPGNAPDYPVLYAAKIARPGGRLILRGETEPYGQYTLFVPRDGSLLEVSFYDSRTRRFGVVTPHLSANARYGLPRLSLHPLSTEVPDSDSDGLPDVAEEVYGTDPSKADTDGDGIPDGAEVDQGTDPLDGFVTRTGVIGTVKTVGPALDIATGEGLAVTAEGSAGISLLDIANPFAPKMLLHLDTPGVARRVALLGKRVLVADGDAGVAVVDISVPERGRIIHQVNAGAANAIAAGAGIGYAGLNSGRVVAIDSLTGSILSQVNVTNAVQDLALEGDYLYALGADRLHVISFSGGVLKLVSSAASPFAVALNQRLFVGGGIAYTVHRTGYNTLNVADPTKPVLLARGNTTQFGWRQIAANGSGLGLAVVGPDSPDASPRNISLYDLSDPLATDVLITVLPTPGNARALSIYNGLAYVADDAAGVQVVNFLPYDSNGEAPSINLTTSFPMEGAESGQNSRVTAEVGDDVQVRTVEFYFDGARVSSDNAFPFEFRFVAPPLSTNKTSFTLRALAIDTGGNSTWSEELTVPLLPDTTAPRVVMKTPVGGGRVVQALTAFFDSLIEPATLGASSFTLVSAGADGEHGSPDDVQVTGGNISYRPEIQAASMTFPAPLPQGSYRAVLSTTITDLSGNPLPAAYSWHFAVADAVFWTREVNGAWDNGENWSEGSVPGAADFVIINVPEANVVVSAGGGVKAIQGLISHERLRLNGTDLRTGMIELHNELFLNGAMVRNAKIVDRGNRSLAFAPTLAGAAITTLFDNVQMQGDINLTANTSALRIQNGFTLEGTIFLNNFATLSFAGTQTWNSGTLVFAGDSGSLRGETRLTLGPALQIRGKSGSIESSGQLVNEGSISADVASGHIRIFGPDFLNPGRIEIRNGGSVTVQTTRWLNTGTMEGSGSGTITGTGSWQNQGIMKVNSSTLKLGGSFTLADLGTVERTGGKVVLAGSLDLVGGTLALNDATGPWIMEWATVKNGTISQTGAGRFSFAPTLAGESVTTVFDNILVQGDINLTAGASKLAIRNSFRVEGKITISNFAWLHFLGDQVWTTGSVVFSGSGGSLLFDTQLTLEPSITIRGNRGTIRENKPAATLINRGTLSADVENSFWTINAANFENAGTIEATAAGAQITIRSPNFVNNGTTEQLNGGKILVNP